jgi:hypothetical protein
MFTGTFTYVKQLSKILILLSLISVANAQQVQTYIRQKLELTATDTTQKFLDTDLKRRYILIQNKGTRAVYIAFEEGQVGTEGIKIPAGGNWEPSKAPTNYLFVKTENNVADIVVIYGWE